VSPIGPKAQPPSPHQRKVSREIVQPRCAASRAIDSARFSQEEPQACCPKHQGPYAPSSVLTGVNGWHSVGRKAVTHLGKYTGEADDLLTRVNSVCSRFRVSARSPPSRDLHCLPRLMAHSPNPTR
jgi:hypothetical protein